MYINFLLEKIYWTLVKRYFKKKQKTYDDWLAKGYNNEPAVSFIIQSHNKSLAVKHIVTQLRKYPQSEIIVIDDGSKHKHTEVLSKFLSKANEFLIRANDLYENVMYDKAIRFANGAYIALLQDDDKISDFTWIDKAIAYFHQYPDLAILGGKNGLDSKIDEQRQILEEEENKQTASKKIDFYFVHTVNRAPMFLNKDLFLKHLQHIDFSLAPFQCDDCELCLRAWVSGLKVAWYNAGFESLMAGGMRIWNNQLMNFQGRKNQKILYEKYKSHLGKISESVNKANNEIR